MYWTTLDHARPYLLFHRFLWLGGVRSGFKLANGLLGFWLAATGAATAAAGLNTAAAAAAAAAGPAPETNCGGGAGSGAGVAAGRVGCIGVVGMLLPPEFVRCWKTIL